MKCYLCDSYRVVPLESITGEPKHKRLMVCLSCGINGTPVAFDYEPESTCWCGELAVDEFKGGQYCLVHLKDKIEEWVGLDDNSYFDLLEV